MFTHPTRAVVVAWALGTLVGCQPSPPMPTMPPDGLAAMKADFDLDGRETPRSVVAERYRRACAQGFEPACSPPSGDAASERRQEMAASLRVSHPAIATWLDGYERDESGSMMERRQDDAHALRRFTQSCESGFGPACVSAVVIGVWEAPSRRFNIGAHWCDRGVAEGCTVAGRVAASRYSPLCDQSPCARGDERAIALWTAGCDAGDGSACTALVRERMKRGTPLDDDAALALGMEACTDGVISSCSLVARLNDKGRILECDPGEPCALGTERASNGYSRACASGDSWSCTRLARHHRQGSTGVCGAHDAPCERSRTRAYELFRDACDGGTPSACTMAGHMARSGETEACEGAGTACAEGDDVALEHFVRACTGPIDPAGCRAGARMLRTGRGVADRYTETERMLQARYLLKRSCFMMAHLASCRALARHHGQTIGADTVVDGILGGQSLACTDGVCEFVCVDRPERECTHREPFALAAE